MTSKVIHREEGCNVFEKMMPEEESGSLTRVIPQFIQVYDHIFHVLRDTCVIWIKGYEYFHFTPGAGDFDICCHIAREMMSRSRGKEGGKEEEKERKGYTHDTHETA